MDIYEESLALHERLRGKITVELKEDVGDDAGLSLVYSPGVAEPCRKIAENPEYSFQYTWRGNVVAVISDGTAVLGLGDIGPEAALPVMEGKCFLFKKFADINAVPIVINTKDTEEIIKFVKQIAPSFGGINLEDISSPRCFEIETRLKQELDIPVFHDDQHGTAIVCTAGLINALKLVQKKPEDCVAVVSGTGAAGSSIIRMIKDLGIQNIYAFNVAGLLNRDYLPEGTSVKDQETAWLTNNDSEQLTMEEAMAKADIFIGVSIKDRINGEMVRSMHANPIIFALANPEPEIEYTIAKANGAAVVGTGRSDYPNQINNVLAFPGLFKGVLSCHANAITEEMKLAAAQAIAGLVSAKELTDEYVIPSAFDDRVVSVVASIVAKKAQELGLARKL